MRKLISIIFLATFPLASLATLENNSPKRDPAQVRAFKKTHACPDGPNKGSKTRCVGYVVDHVAPLCAGGPDRPENMVWQTVEQAKVKDKWEKELCAKLRSCN